ncbi:MAG: hypothetical protein WDW38_005221 [Sanguina aurantia]
MEPEVVTSESKIAHIGAVCLSPCMEKVLMVQLKQAASEWSFPYRADKKAAGQSALGKDAASSAVQSLVGVNVTHCTYLANPIEGELEAGVSVTLFVATNVSESLVRNLSPNSIVGASEWLPLDQVLSGQIACSTATTDVVLPQLRALLDSHAATAPSEAKSEEAATSSQQKEWIGIDPKGHLAEYCTRNQLPGPCYSLVFRRNSGRSFSTSSCILTHCGIQITPEGNSTSQECSEQAAAMCALLWLSGSLDPNGPSARVVPVGYPPLIRPDQLANFEPTPHTKESRQRDLLMKQLQDKRGQLAVEMAELERTHKALESGEMTHAAAALAVPEAAASPPGSRPPTPAKRARTAGSALGEVQASLSNLGPAPTGSVQFPRQPNAVMSGLQTLIVLPIPQ